jgi:hypothetical protein
MSINGGMGKCSQAVAGGKDCQLVVLVFISGII